MKSSDWHQQKNATVLRHRKQIECVRIYLGLNAYNHVVNLPAMYRYCIYRDVSIIHVPGSRHGDTRTHHHCTVRNVFKDSQLSKTYWQHENKNVSLMHISVDSGLYLHCPPHNHDAACAWKWRMWRYMYIYYIYFLLSTARFSEALDVRYCL